MKDASSQLKVVVRGTGSIGMRHISVFRDLLGMHTIAVPKRQGRSRLLQEEGYTSTEDLPQALAAADSILVMASDTNCHVEDSIEGLSLGCSSILIEKPLAPSLPDALRLHAAIDKCQGIRCLQSAILILD
jgi:predicted dehydrogenase